MTNSPPWLSPGTWIACGAAVIGAEGHLVQADAGVSDGAAAFSIQGLPEISVRETRDRVRAATLNSGLPWPDRGVTVTLQPLGLPKHGTGLDLAIAVAVLTATGAVAGVPAGCLFYGELGLDGTLRPVRGVLPAVLAAARVGCTRAVVPEQNAAEAVAVPGVTAIPARSLRAVVSWLRGNSLPARPGTGPVTAAPFPDVYPEIGLDQLAVPPVLRLALEASAAGGHHLCLTGPPGAPVPALAAAAAALMPPLQREEMMEVAAVYSAAGLLGPGHALITRPPLRAPHHTITPARMGGGGSGVMRPGEAALAHRGVLFLGDVPEFSRSVLGMLRQPLQDGEIVVARAGVTTRFPAAFTLIAGMSPCPCHAWTSCTCSPLAARRYRGRFISELGSHVALWLDVAQAGPAEGGASEPARHADAISVARVAAARDRAHHRLSGEAKIT
ncbi:MAG TPA: ATP-binding protein [Streptosporangiaceae bacterium]|nr:ATP-binding protein [Streptosporangiaceae bacterium]